MNENNCYNTGDILCTANSIYCLPGGILGYIQNGTANANIEITNCYNTGFNNINNSSINSTSKEKPKKKKKKRRKQRYRKWKRQ